MFTEKNYYQNPKQFLLGHWLTYFPEKCLKSKQNIPEYNRFRCSRNLIIILDKLMDKRGLFKYFLNKALQIIDLRLFDIGEGVVIYA